MGRDLHDDVAARLAPEEIVRRRKALALSQEVMREVEIWAEHVVEEAVIHSKELEPDLRHLYWRLIYYHAASQFKLCDEVPPGPRMSKREWREFRKTRIPLGRYRGEPVNRVSYAYLVSLVHLPEEHEEFFHNLRRYLRTPPSLMEPHRAK